MKKVKTGKIKSQLRLDGYYNVLNKYGTIAPNIIAGLPVKQ